MSGAHTWASSKENDAQPSDAPSASTVKDDNNRDWAREMIGLKAGEKLSNSASSRCRKVLLTKERPLADGFVSCLFHRCAHSLARF